LASQPKGFFLFKQLAMISKEAPSTKYHKYQVPNSNLGKVKRSRNIREFVAFLSTNREPRTDNKQQTD
jgi:hypothetical protein